MPVCCAGKRWVFARRRPATGLPPLPWSLLAPLTWHSSASPRRLEALRQLVPHTERANTANFLEEVVLYVQRLQVRLGHGGWHSCSCCTMGRLCGGSLHRPFQVACRCPLNSRAPLFRVCSAVQRRVVDLERQLGLAPTVQLSSKVITFSGEARGALKGVVCDCFSMPCGLYVQCGTDANPGSALAGLGAAPGTAPAYVPVAAQLTACCAAALPALARHLALSTGCDAVRETFHAGLSPMPPLARWRLQAAQAAVRRAYALMDPNGEAARCPMEVEACLSTQQVHVNAFAPGVLDMVAADLPTAAHGSSAIRTRRQHEQLRRAICSIGCAAGWLGAGGMQLPWSAIVALLKMPQP